MESVLLISMVYQVEEGELGWCILLNCGYLGIRGFRRPSRMLGLRLDAGGGGSCIYLSADFHCTSDAILDEEGEWGGLEKGATTSE